MFDVLNKLICSLSRSRFFPRSAGWRTRTMIMHNHNPPSLGLFVGVSMSRCLLFPSRHQDTCTPALVLRRRPQPGGFATIKLGISHMPRFSSLLLHPTYMTPGHPLPPFRCGCSETKVSHQRADTSLLIFRQIGYDFTNHTHDPI